MAHVIQESEVLRERVKRRRSRDSGKTVPARQVIQSDYMAR